MKPLGITTAVALALLAGAWALVRSDVLQADALRFVPVVLALVVAAGIVVAVIQRRQAPKPRTSSKRRRK